MSDGIQIGDGYTFQTLNGVSSLSIDKPYAPENNPGLLLSVKLPPFPDINGPALPEWSWSNIVQQFQVETLIVGTKQYVRIAKGAVNFTVSNMPEIYDGAVSDVRQAWIYGVAVRPGITVVNGGDSSSPWMEDGGYYELPTTGTYYVTISKLDIAGSTSDSALLQENVPFVSIFSASSDLYDKIFSETGPSQYLNKTNVQKMAGYDAETTGLSGDFGNCHTTWFLPVKWGYACKIIAVIESVVPVITAPTIEVSRAATATSNEVHTITIPPEAKKVGSFKLGYEPGFFNSTQTDPFDPFNPLNSGSLTGQFQWNLSNALKKIQELRGNSSVTVSGENKLDITYINEYANTAVPLPDIIDNTIGVPSSTYEVMQHVIGSIDLSIGLSFIGTTLMNVPDWVESEDDPYNEYEANNWEDISNATQKDNIEGIAAQNTDYYTLVISPFDWTSSNYSWNIPASCIPEPTNDHPFKVIYEEGEGGTSTYRIVSGTVNNRIPGNISSTITVSTTTFDVWIKVPFNDTATPKFPATSGFEWNIGTPVPDDTDSEGYIRVARVNGASVTQFVTGSLWADRIKLGTDTAKYYYSRI